MATKTPSAEGVATGPPPAMPQASATGALPGLRVASPERHAETGVRWFVTADREAVYAFDPIQRSVRDNRPDLAPIRRFLAKPQGDPPVGWVRVR